MTTYLLDANVLIALVVQEHEHHTRVDDWLGTADDFALCPIVEGALVRFLVRLGESPATTSALLQALRSSSRCQFWPDSISYADADLTSVRGHRQVTDAYLVSLARACGGTLATMDAGLAALHTDSLLLPG